MKKLITIIAAVCFAFSYGQKVSDYKYVALPEKFSGFKGDQYKLDVLLSKTLKQKQYVVVSGSRSQWPAEANSNPCGVLNADVINDSGFLRNKIILEFKDCNSKVITSQKASTSIKEFLEGYQDALKQALVAIPVSSPKEIQTEMVIQEVQSTNPVMEVQVEKVENSSNQQLGKYSNGKIDLQKIQIDSDQFILVENNSSVPFATFKPTTKKDTFKVKLKSGESTIGYFETGNIVIEMPKGGDDYTKEIFILK
ncbi:hypothetical protein CHRY9390_00870 [Chryseobacterium aquaeductus]|uniref:Uncharacterized protein n=1 Tax=Chryseobacterium aquaeductus TaxID=2675056 RepID=A0A9N8MGE4_9FLAO|nr:hypothetical protein [Chryseobacterium aquaeductus]CAA7330216.1 hypothetical protein CHRY9390_00870 [Chryseobacterium potabilaquae]CAD7802085.1 hypothetical protein CHRY9390_00870 [Chryseobacterium aquaeductus]